MADSWARKQLYGSDESGESVTDEMGDTYLGDVSITSPATPARNGGNRLLRALAIGALGAAIPGAGIVGYLLSQAADAEVTPAPAVEKIGLGKITDFNLRDE